MYSAQTELPCRDTTLIVRNNNWVKYVVKYILQYFCEMTCVYFLNFTICFHVAERLLITILIQRYKQIITHYKCVYNALYRQASSVTEMVTLVITDHNRQ